MSYKSKIDSIKKFQLHDTDTGSTGVQVALLTDRINALTKHFQEHKKDKNSKRGFLKLISQRKKLIKYYVASHGNDEYLKLIADLGLRK